MQVWENIAKECLGFPGLIGVIVFGSYARGDYGRKSDIDLLLVFKDKALMKQAEEELKPVLYSVDSRLSPDFVSLDEFRSYAHSNPFFLLNLLKEGVILYSTPELKISVSKTLDLEPKILLTFKTSKLPSKVKAKIYKKLYGRKTATQEKTYFYEGLVKPQERIGHGVLIDPSKAEEIKRLLRENNIKYLVREVFIPTILPEPYNDSPS